jgi:site-specific DNA-cytosine methylase
MKTICLNSKVNGKQPSLTDRVYSMGGLSTAVTTTTFFMGSVLEENNMNEENRKPRLRIRKLTEGECYRLMGFEKKDAEACKAAGQSAANVYHQAGDSIVTTVLMGIIGELMDVDYRPKIEAYCDKLADEVR